jgi:orotate phosphoribosyltransferase
MENNLNYVSLFQLLSWTNEWLKSFPRSYDLIMGIPRSGLLVASIIALKLAKPLSTPEHFLQGKCWRSKAMHKENNLTSILLVDDSITSGRTMKRVAGSLLEHSNNITITRAALMATKNSCKLIDLYHKIIPHPRIFEWNLLHAKKGSVACDMDGVLCENCPSGIDKNEEMYTKWLENARPYLIPAFTLDAIVSNRLEKYRPQTETWLAKHKVRYKQLIMWDLQSKAVRKGQYARHKTELLLQIRPEMFWESSYHQAKQICKATGIPTFCTDTMTFLNAD